MVWNAPRGDGTGTGFVAPAGGAAGVTGLGVSVFTTTTIGVTGVPGARNGSEGGLLLM
jgi:hypothetical protein